MTAEVRMVAVGGQPLRVALRSGDRRRTPLLLLNGIGVGLDALDPFVEALDPAIPVIRFDPPGVGGSPLPATPYRLPGLARTVLGLLDLLGQEEVDVLGISWGGGLAQQLARSGRRRCRRLVLVATSTGALMVPAHPSVLARMATPRRHFDRNHMGRIAAEVYGGSARTDPLHATWLLHTHSRVGPRRGYYYQLLASAGWTSIPFLHTLPQPTLVLTGDDDPLIPPINGRLLAALIPKARLHVYRGGHLELAADPGLLVPVIEKFLHNPTAASGPVLKKENRT